MANREPDIRTGKTGWAWEAPGAASPPPDISDVQLDFLRELMNISSGNVVPVFTRILRRPVTMGMPRLFPWPPGGPHFLREHSALFLTCAIMRMVGDVAGALALLVPDADRTALTALVTDASPARAGDTTATCSTVDDASITHLADITASVFLNIVHRFCGVAVHHASPDIVSARASTVIEKAFTTLGHRDPPGLLLETPFTVPGELVRFHLLMVLPPEDAATLTGAIKTARALCVE